MSLVSSHITTHDAQCSDRRHARRHASSLWSDTAERKFEQRFFDEMDEEDRLYSAALRELDTQFNRAAKLLGPI